ncbi:MAG: hypothetical protein WC130_11325 [Kiritimatiellia bacterium]
MNMVHSFEQIGLYRGLETYRIYEDGKPQGKLFVRCGSGKYGDGSRATERDMKAFREWKAKEESGQ